MKFEITENKALNERILSGVHESGLRVYIIPKTGFCKYYAIYGTDYGSLDDYLKIPGTDSEIALPDGIAHFLEHKLFEEEDGKNAFDKFALTGASSNAFTSFDMTAYLFSCTDNFYENLDILLEFVNSPYFTDENVAKEQGIIGQEIKMYDDDPNWRLFFNMLTGMYHNNPVKKDIAGTVESISHITPELLYKCCDAYYNPSNMVLVMVGDIDPEKAVSYIDKYVTPEKDRGKIERRIVDEPDSVVQKIVRQKLSISKPQFLIGFKEKEEGLYGRELLKKQIRTKILMEVLFGKSGSFFTELYSEGLIDASFGKDSELEVRYGFSSISGETSEPEKVYEKTLAYLEEMKKKPLDMKAVNIAKRVLIGKNLRRFNSVERLGNDFIRCFMSGFNPLEYSELVENVTVEELEARLKEHFDADCCVLSIIEPMDGEQE
ncbi:MAG: insulinase family protein [Ruminococcaceae bacterium]|nr:insulinase family protein [Oscillospiraceae bacterium]